MYWYVAIALLLVLPQRISSAPSPLRLTIDCSGSNERLALGASDLRANSPEPFNCRRFDVDSFCGFIHRAIPKAIKDGKFVLIEPETDQLGFSDTQSPVAIAPPQGFIPKWGVPRIKKRLKVPTMNVPELIPRSGNPVAPRIRSGSVMSLLRTNESEEESSAERMAKFKKAVQKMLRVVKVLSQIDQYLSERTRIVIDKISKTLAE